MSPIKVLHGRPTPEELAVVVALVSARSATVAAAPRTDSGPVSAWTDRSRATARRPHPGPYAWRASARPR